MPEETCPQILSLEGHDIGSLCSTCVKQTFCGFALASELIGERHAPGVRQIHIIAECDGYERIDCMDGAPERGNLGPLLWQASVADLCCACPSDVKGDCVRHHELERIKGVSIAGRGWIRPQVVCCDMSQKLYQISEPRK